MVLFFTNYTQDRLGDLRDYRATLDETYSRNFYKYSPPEQEGPCSRTTLFFPCGFFSPTTYSKNVKQNGVSHRLSEYVAILGINYHYILSNMHKGIIMRDIKSKHTNHTSA